MHRLPRLLLLTSVFLLTLSLEGCPATNPTTAGTPPATTSTALQTFDAIYASAVSADDLVVKTASTALTANLINFTQAKKILAITDSVKAALDAANAAAQIGNTALATGNLASALGPIAILSACLTTKPLTVSTFDACAAKLTPPVQT
jgi:hypothetical protein